MNAKELVDLHTLRAATGPVWAEVDRLRLVAKQRLEAMTATRAALLDIARSAATIDISDEGKLGMAIGEKEFRQLCRCLELDVAADEEPIAALRRMAERADAEAAAALEAVG